ncbi:hypothetical protein [Motiliproteus sediminis]|uniref:hypothetical protein n=1 Tax=Motiliproteus sediminis TaxID=1468178 RepID=UPI001AF01CAF|nr:hypothetical protein [Motiliproteus sediminis]
MVQAAPGVGQPFFVFQPYTPYVSGDTRYTYDRDLFNTRDSRLSSSQDLETTLNGRYGGRGYLWRPWFSQLSSDLDVNLSHRVASGDTSSDESVSWDGSLSASLDLVPRSHVPFNSSLFYSRDDTQSELLRLRMQQEVNTFSPVVPDYRFSYEYENRRRRTSESERHNFLSRLDGDYRQHDYSAQLNVLQLNNESSTSASETLTYDLTADHRYDWRDDLSVSEFVSAFDSTTDSGDSEAWAGGAQTNVIATWSPLGSWSGNALLSARQNESSFEDTFDRTSFRQTEYTGSVALEYRPNSDFRTSLSSTYSHVDRREDGVSEQSDVVLSSFYTPALTTLGEFDYRWDASGRYRVAWVNSVRTDDADAGVGHTLSRRWGGRGSEWLLDINQDLSSSFIQASETSDVVELSQRASLSWRGEAESYRDYALLSFSDRREFFGTRAEAQSIDMSFNRQGDLGRFSRWEVDVNYQIFREVGEDGQSSVDDDASSRGKLTLLYTRANVWGIFNLYFRSELDAQLDYEKEDDSVMRDSRWENALEYRLGRLSSELSVEVTEADDGATGALFFEVRRRWDSR